MAGFVVGMEMSFDLCYWLGFLLLVVLDFESLMSFFVDCLCWIMNLKQFSVNH